jgi:hypothetical protein
MTLMIVKCLQSLPLPPVSLTLPTYARFWHIGFG